MRTLSYVSDAVAVADGLSMRFAIRADGSLWSWGLNASSQLADGSTTAREYPVPVLNTDLSPFTNVVAVAAGSTHTLALTADGSVWAWGTNESGRLGDGTTTPRAHPVRVRNAAGPLTGMVAIAAGGMGGMALAHDGTVWTWGDNSFGQLGDNTTRRALTRGAGDGPAGRGFDLARVGTPALVDARGARAGGHRRRGGDGLGQQLEQPAREPAGGHL